MAHRRPAVLPLKRVLLATDFTVGATGALRRTALLPLTAGSVLRLLHVIPTEVPTRLLASEKSEARRRLVQARAAVAKALRARRTRGVDIQVAVVHGEPALAIAHHAEARRMELIVVGRHGARGFRDALLGSTAERIIRAGKVPVLVVAGPVRYPYRRALVAMDLSAAGGALVDLTTRLIAASAPLPRVVHAVEAPLERIFARVARPRDLARYHRECREAAQTVLEAALAGVGHQPPGRDLILRRGDPREVILGIAHREQADLIVLGTHGRGGLPHLLLGSIAEAVIRHAGCDVLVAKPGRIRRGARAATSPA